MTERLDTTRKRGKEWKQICAKWPERSIKMKEWVTNQPKRDSQHISVSRVYEGRAGGLFHICTQGLFSDFDHFTRPAQFHFHSFPKASLVLGFWQETCFLSSSLEGLHDSQTLKFVLVMQPGLVNVRLRTFLHYFQLFHACRNSSARD